MEIEHDWDQGVPFVLYAACEAVQETPGFSPAELAFEHSVRGPLKALQEEFLYKEVHQKDGVTYVSSFKESLCRGCSLAKESLTSAQAHMKINFDKKFQPCDKVLVLLPSLVSSVTSKFSGHYTVDSKLSDTNYVIRTPEHRRSLVVCHVNMLKPYNSWSDEVNGVMEGKASLGVSVDAVLPVSADVFVDDNDGLVGCEFIVCKWSSV